MKNVSDFLSIASVVILFGYITYNEAVKTGPEEGRFSDEAVAQVEMEMADEPLQAISFDLPASASFAGEKVPLDQRDVRESLDRELQINIYTHSNTIFLIKRANRWLPQIEQILKRQGIPEDFKYVPLIESGLVNATSNKEAVGFWQILKSSGKEYGLEINREVDERYDPLKSTGAACQYLKKAYERFGNWTLVAASFDRGINGMRRALEDQKANSYYDLYLNDETSRYVFRILAIKEIIRNPDKYGFKINPRHLYEPERLTYVEVDNTVKDLVDFAIEHGTNYKFLKRYNPWLREDRLTVKHGKRYRVAIPVLGN